MKSFFKYAGEFLRTYPQIRITTREEILIRDECMKHLGLTNLGQLRDRYEGQSFFDKTLMNIGSLMAIQKHLGLSLIDVSQIDLGDFKPKLIINDQEIDVLVFDFGTLPLVNMDNLDRDTFFVIQKDRVTFNLCGVASKETIKENVIDTHIERSTYANNMNFIGFSYLSSTEEIIEK